MYNNGNYSGVKKDEYGTMTLVANNITLQGNVTIQDNNSTTQRIGKLV